VAMALGDTSQAQSRSRVTGNPGMSNWVAVLPVCGL
jgi:hypothetical protein